MCRNVYEKQHSLKHHLHLNDARCSIGVHVQWHSKHQYIYIYITCLWKYHGMRLFAFLEVLRYESFSLNRFYRDGRQMVAMQQKVLM